MLNQRVGLRALRAAAKPSFFSQQAPRMALAAQLSTTQARPVATTKLSNDEGHQILVNQRLNRPVSPHLTVYKVGQTWFSNSAWTRITGCTLSGGAYIFFTSYLAAPLFGWHLESASLAAAAASAPVITGVVKMLLAFPFSYHFINGISHLVYDVGIAFKKSTIQKTEFVVWGSSVLASLFLAFGL
jgi:succinate dehydrogenase (ubiquinone) cytochrome b560 subunit